MKRLQEADELRKQKKARFNDEPDPRVARDPIQVPISAIFTRRDGIVEWSACIDRNSNQVTHFEVGSTHLSMGFDPDVWRIVASEIGLAKTQ